MTSRRDLPRRYTLHLDVVAASPEQVWVVADRVSDELGSPSYSVSDGEDWAQLVPPPDLAGGGVSL